MYLPMTGATTFSSAFPPARADMRRPGGASFDRSVRLSRKWPWNSHEAGRITPGRRGDASGLCIWPFFKQTQAAPWRDDQTPSPPVLLCGRAGHRGHRRGWTGDLAFRPRPARLPAARRLRAAGHDTRLCRRRQAAGRARDRAPGFRADRGDPEARRRRVPVGRGQELLHASRGRSDFDPARRADRSRALGQRPAPGRRLDDHAAGRKEHAAVRRGIAPAQGPRGAAGDPHRTGAVEGPHPRIVPERDLSRFRRLRRRRRFADLFQQVARRADARRGGLPRRPAESPQQLQPGPLSAGGQGAPRLGPRPHGRGRHRDRSRHQGRESRAAAGAAPRGNRDRVGALFLRGGAARPAGALWREGPVRGRPRGAHEPRSGDAGSRRQGAARRADRL